jgi:hypothetical protein
MKVKVRDVKIARRDDPASVFVKHLRVASATRLRQRQAETLRVTLPALRQEVHTLTRLGVPPTIARTRWMFGFQRRLVRM